MKNATKKRKKKRVIPGFGISLGITVTMLGFIVLIPLCSLVVFSANLSFKEFVQVITRPRVLSSYYVSFKTAFIAAVIDAVMGMIMAWVLVRYEFPGKKIMNGIIELPFALPTAVAGISLTHLTTANGWIGSFFDQFGIKIAYTRIGITVALVFIGIPFVVRAVQPVLEKIDIQYEEAANILGANPRQTMMQVIFPEILPALIGGFTLSFARGLGEYGSVVFIAGNQPYKTEIAPLMIMSELQEYDYASATSIALVMLLVAFVILFVNAVLQSRTSKIISGIS
ncbi:sulfate ABC transporter permease subunit CysT [Lacrimispora sp.]|uniref:sulfate ABC transporter permease subunit CysT n=1 Tax=Lacrimispora sp. TaxID=2719234 RepID=UPI002FDA99EC